jgi:hypothetical protein
MCIYGVTRIGTGSLGPSRFLPTLVTALEATRPALVFLSGAWFTLYLLNRRTRTAPLTGRVLALLLLTGLLGVADAAAEAAYLVIPKKEHFLSVGCCTEATVAEARAARFLPTGSFGEEAEGWLFGAYYLVNLGVLGGLLLCGRRYLPGAGLALVLLLGVLSLAVNAVFLVEVAAPRLLGLPYHHCPYDLLPRAPESLVTIALFFVGLFALGAAGVVRWLGRAEETAPLLPGAVNRLLRIAFLGYLGSLLMMTVGLVLT